MLKIYLQSFFTEARGLPISVARFQPDGYSYPSLEFFKPFLKDRSPIRFKNPKHFLEAYCYCLIRNFEDIHKWVTEETGKDFVDLSLCCWCNMERGSLGGKLLCHTILAGYLIENILRKEKIEGVCVEYVDGRDKPVWTREEFNGFMRSIVGRE